MEDEQVVPTSEEQEVTEEVTPQEDVQEEKDEEVDWKAKAQKAEELANNYKIRAEKAEKKAKEAPQAPSQENISTRDLLALTEAKISSEDFDEVVRMSKLLGKPIHEAIKDSAVTTILNTRAEERRTASATSTKSARGVKPTSGTDYLQKAERTGEVPDTDEGLLAMHEARLARKRQR